MLSFLAFLLLVRQNLAVIYSINETEYQRMPPLFKMDDYRDCMLEPGGTYCLATYDLHSRGHSDLMRFILEYSEHTLKHFNHTQIHRATCVTTTCRKYLNKTLNIIEDQGMILEECINQTIWRSYQIEASLSEIYHCKRYNDKIVLDISDYVVATIYLLIILLNTVGSFYDICRDNKKKGNPYLLAFSMKRNWSRLTSPGGSGDDPRIERLKCFNGLRTMTMICVIFSHTALVMTSIYMSNPFFVEKAYDDLLKQILFNGTLVTHTFFVMSGFLLGYNLQIYSEKQQITWWHIPKGVILRWIRGLNDQKIKDLKSILVKVLTIVVETITPVLIGILDQDKSPFYRIEVIFEKIILDQWRLTPPYALVIATIGTWMRHVGDGPHWQMMVTSEADVCRQYWWANILYFNNYLFKNDLCFPQGWYLAADTQLFCFGLVLFVLIQNPRGRKISLVMLFLVSLTITASHTYFQDLDAVVLQSPETYRKLFVNNDTFLSVYIPGHTNLSTYILGLAGGLLTYHWQVTEVNLSKLKNLFLYRWAFWMLYPLGVAIILTGGIFYQDGFTPSTFLRISYAMLYKPIFQTLVVGFIIGCIFKVDRVYRGIIEWRGFTWTGRVSYSAFLLHTIFQRSYVGLQVHEIFINEYSMFIFLSASVFLSFLVGSLLWLTVEAPVSGLTRALLAPKNNSK